MNEFAIYSIAVITLCIIAKLVFWILIKKKSKRLLYRSFFRFYSVYDMHDAPSIQTLTFWKASNIINIFFWLGIVMLILHWFFGITITD